MRFIAFTGAAAFLAAAPAFAQAGPAAGEAAFRATYEELVETNTTLKSLLDAREYLNRLVKAYSND